MARAWLPYRSITRPSWPTKSHASQIQNEIFRFFWPPIQAYRRGQCWRGLHLRIQFPRTTAFHDRLTTLVFHAPFPFVAGQQIDSDSTDQISSRKAFQLLPLSLSKYGVTSQPSSKACSQKGSRRHSLKASSAARKYQTCRTSSNLVHCPSCGPVVCLDS